MQQTNTKSTSSPKDKVLWGIAVAYGAGLAIYGVMGLMVNPPSLHYNTSSASEKVTALERDRVVEPTTISGARFEYVRNGNFEDPIIRSNSQFVTDGTPELGWQVSWTNDVGKLKRSVRQAGVEFLAGFSGWKAASGQQFVRLDAADLGGRAGAGQSLATLSQVLQTTTGSQLIISLSVAAQPKTPAVENALEIKWNGVVVGSVSPDGTKDKQPVWKRYTFAVIGTGSDILELRGQGPENRQGILVDAISVRPQ